MNAEKLENTTNNPSDVGCNSADTMTVTVRDRGSEAPWGSGFTNPVTRTVTISAFCPVDGVRRGEPQGQNCCDDGAYYWVQVWQNPCGHVDHYVNVLNAARQRASHTATDGGTAAGGESA